MTMCAPCGLDGPCTDGDCTVRVPIEHYCPACTTPWSSVEAAKRCAIDDGDDRHPFTD